MSRKIKKVLLIMTPAFTLKSGRDINPLPPIGLGYLAAVLKELGIEVRILDCLMRGWEIEVEIDDLFTRVGLPEKVIEEYVREFDPDLVGVNCQFSRQHKMYHQMFSMIKRAKQECITMGGGAHVTVCPEEVLKDSSCDFILLGEAEESFRDFIIKFNQGMDIASVDGLGWKADGKIHINNKTKWLSDLDTLPFPAYDIMEIERYLGLEGSHGLRHKDRFCPIITSRGCPAKCTFCSALRVWGDRYRFRSVENVLDEMRLLKNKYGIQEIMFEDDNVTANPKRAKELFLGMAKEKFDFVWDTPNGVGAWNIDEEMIDLMKESGCIKLNFPVESGSQDVLNTIIKKPLNLEKVKALVKYCQKIKLDYGMFLVIGMPGEKISDIWQSFKFAVECGCYLPHVSIATPYPGTELFSICKANGYLAREFTLDDLFIRSFSIKTTDWSEKDLKKVYSRGMGYFKIRGMIANPISIWWTFMKYLKNPGLSFAHLKKLFM